jgi:hypothetical protein
MLLLSAAAAAWAVAGCEAPKGDSGGRVEVHRTTKAERRASGMTVSDLASASDQIAQKLVRDLNRIVSEELRDPALRAWVVFGAIDNKSQTMPRSDFEYLRERIKDKLQESSDWRDNIKFVASRATVEELNRREFPEREDPLQTRSGGDGVERPAREHFYYLNGSAYGVLRGSTEDYSVSFNLTRASDGAEIFSSRYEVKYEKKSR